MKRVVFLLAAVSLTSLLGCASNPPPPPVAPSPAETAAMKESIKRHRARTRSPRRSQGRIKGSSENRCYELGDEAPGWRGARRRNARRIATTSNDASRDGSASKSLQIFSDEP